LRPGRTGRDERIVVDLAAGIAVDVDATYRRCTGPITAFAVTHRTFADTGGAICAVGRNCATGRITAGFGRHTDGDRQIRIASGGRCKKALKFRLCPQGNDDIEGRSVVNSPTFVGADRTVSRQTGRGPEYADNVDVVTGIGHVRRAVEAVLRRIDRAEAGSGCINIGASAEHQGNKPDDKCDC
jgi:hypothetical protein